MSHTAEEKYVARLGGFCSEDIFTKNKKKKEKRKEKPTLMLFAEWCILISSIVSTPANL